MMHPTKRSRRDLHFGAKNYLCRREVAKADEATLMKIANVN